MPVLIKDAQVCEDTWTLISDQNTEDASALPEGQVIVPLGLWKKESSALKKRDKLGVWLNSDEAAENIQDDINCFDVIAVNFPVFTDGRGFSYGRVLREQLKYTGEIRAIGNIIIDQLFYLKRVGFNAFVLEDDTEIDTALAALETFSENYQGDVDVQTPLLLRR